MKRPLIIIVSVIIVFMLVGISAMQLFSLRVGNTFSSDSYELPGYGGGAPAEPAVYDSASPLFVSEEAKMNVVTQSQQERLVIQNADLSIVVKDPQAQKEAISALAEQLGGYVVSSNTFKSISSSGIEVPGASIVIRVPSEKLDEALEKIKSGAVDIQYENRSGQDVTDQYVDLTSRLKAKQVAEKKLLEIMNGAEDTESVLAVYVQLQQIQSEIEVLTGQIKYLEESAALSAVSVQLVAEATLQPLEVGGWRLDSTAREAWDKLNNFVRGFSRLLVQLFVYVIPAALLVVGTFYLIFLGGRGLWRRFGKSKAVVEVKRAEKK